MSGKGADWLEALICNLGLRELLKEFRCSAKKRDKECSHMEEEEFLKTETLNL